MPGVDKPDFDALLNLDFLAHGAGPEPFQAALRVLDVVDGLHRRLARPGILPGLPLGILGLDMGTVLQHDAAEVGGLVGGIDSAPEPVFHQQRQQPRVVNMGVGQKNKLESRRAHWQALVFKAVLPLLHPAVHQPRDSVALQHGAAACYLMGGS